MTEIACYNFSLENYQKRLPEVKEKLSNFDPLKAPLVDTQVTPYSINIVAGIPLFRSHSLQRDYEEFKHDLEQILKNQFSYDNWKTHISIATPIRCKQRSIADYSYQVSGEKKVFYREYLNIFEKIKFSPFSLKIEGLYPAGILLFQPEENENQIFELRKQIFEELIEAKKMNPSLYFETNQNGFPKIDTGIVHSTFLRFSDRGELQARYSDYLLLLEEINIKIKNGQLFSKPLMIEDISFIETRFSNPITRRDWHTNEIILRKNTHE